MSNATKNLRYRKDTEWREHVKAAVKRRYETKIKTDPLESAIVRLRSAIWWQRCRLENYQLKVVDAEKRLLDLINKRDALIAQRQR